jgi:O-antigen/teichoic acid export membrane protein
MRKLRTFVKDFSIVSLGNVFSRLLAALIAIIIARYLGPENFGKYSILFSVMVIIASGLTGVDSTYIHNKTNQFEKNKFSYSDYVTSKFLISAIIVIIGISSSQYLNKFVFDNEVTTLGLMISFLSALSFIAFTQTYTFYQAKQNFLKFSYIQVLFYLFVLLITLVLLYLKIKEYKLFLIPYLITGFAIFFLFILFNKLEFSSNINSLINFFKKGRWIILSVIFDVLIARLDFLILSHYIKGETLGFYSAAMRFINIYLTFTAAFSVILLPKASSIKNESQKRLFYKASFLLSLLLILLNITLIFSSSIITQILFGSPYLPSVKLTQLLLIAYIPFTLYQPFRYLTYTFNKTNILFLVPFIQNILLLIIGQTFIQKLGTQGIIYAKTIVFILGFMIFFISVFKKKFPDGKYVQS